MSQKGEAVRIPAEADHSRIALELVRAKRSLVSDPGAAVWRAREFLEEFPDCPEALLLLADALRRTGDVQNARAILEASMEILPRPEAASVQDSAPANEHLQLQGAVAVSGARRLGKLEDLMLEFLESEPDDVDAINLLAKIALSNQRMTDAEALLERCIELAPDFAEVRYNFAVALLALDKNPEGIAELERILVQEPQNPAYRTLMGAALVADGQLEKSLRWHEAIVRDFPAQLLAWTNYAETLGALGRQDECIAAYREVIRRCPWFGAAWWALASQRAFRFAEPEIGVMQAQLARPDLPSDDRILLHFALGKACEVFGRYAESFENYDKGNAIRRADIRYSADRASLHVSNCKALFTRDFFDERSAAGCATAGPIFIVSLPRSGSSLIEQILSSHSAIEGIGELPDILMLAKNIHYNYPGWDYPEVLDMLDLGELKALGERYLETSRVRRKLGRPWFTDKAPRNYNEIGFIHLILPNAKIIDVRRHPLACCFSNFAQHYTSGQIFTYNLTDLGRSYRDYVELMAHYDEVLPGRIHRVFYEDLVQNPEQQVRRLLDYLELPFEQECLRFYETERHVKTASAEQVRLPIYRDAVEHWRNYEPWLDSLKEALGPVLAAYPGVHAEPD